MEHLAGKFVVGKRTLMPEVNRRICYTARTRGCHLGGWADRAVPGNQSGQKDAIYISGISLPPYSSDLHQLPFAAQRARDDARRRAQPNVELHNVESPWSRLDD
jgi:hypothetical protein